MFKKVYRTIIMWTALLRENIIACIIITVLFTTNFLLIVRLKDLSTFSRIIHYHIVDNKDISCHKRADGGLPAADDQRLSFAKSIFFHETSCSGGLNSRQACSIESAARANPNWNVNVLFSGPVSKVFLNGGTFTKLQELANVNIARINMTKYAKGTPIESVIINDVLTKSKFGIEHAADILRVLTLYKYGGVYLDLDMLSVKSFDSLPTNWVARESNESIGNGILAVSKNKIGIEFSAAAVREIQTNFRPDIWAHNGPQLIFRILQKMCSTTNVVTMSADKCKGIKFYDTKYFFPLHWSQRNKFFEPGKLDLGDSYTYHLWNKYTFATRVPMESFYAKLAERFCPSIYELYGDEFGS